MTRRDARRPRRPPDPPRRPRRGAAQSPGCTSEVSAENVPVRDGPSLRFGITSADRAPGGLDQRPPRGGRPALADPPGAGGLRARLADARVGDQPPRAGERADVTYRRQERRGRDQVHAGHGHQPPGLRPGQHVLGDQSFDRFDLACRPGRPRSPAARAPPGSAPLPTRRPRPPSPPVCRLKTRRERLQRLRRGPHPPGRPHHPVLARSRSHRNSRCRSTPTARPSHLHPGGTCCTTDHFPTGTGSENARATYNDRYVLNAQPEQVAGAAH
jgi:hypothetical protein